MKRPTRTEVLFIAAAALTLTALPYLILTWQPEGKGRVINVAGYNLADPEPGVYVISEGRPLFKRNTTNVIKVREGELVTLRLTSMDEIHGFGLLEYNISETLHPARITTVEFLADKTGEFEFYCNARSCGPGHLEMKGKLIVEPR